MLKIVAFISLQILLASAETCFCSKKEYTCSIFCSCYQCRSGSICNNMKTDIATLKDAAVSLNNSATREIVNIGSNLLDLCSKNQQDDWNSYTKWEIEWCTFGSARTNCATKVCKQCNSKMICDVVHANMKTIRSLTDSVSIIQTTEKIDKYCNSAFVNQAPYLLIFGLLFFKQLFS
jgi:hypothetical protein